MSYRDLVPFDEDTEVAIKRETLEGLRDAYIVVATTQAVGPGPYEALESWIEGVLEEAGMSETVRVAIQKDWEERRKRREAEAIGGAQSDGHKQRLDGVLPGTTSRAPVVR